MNGREEQQSKVDKVALSMEKSKGKGKEKTFEEFYEEVDKDIDVLCPLEDEALKPKKKRKVTMKKGFEEQLIKRREEKEISKIEKGEEGKTKESRMKEALYATRVSRLFIVEKGLYLYKGTMHEILASPIRSLKAIRRGMVDLFYRS
uniref:Protein MNN4-like n=2 Tax=Cucumis melo TaxID=3656 RepID=A0A9I9D5U2_CUCME